MVPIIMIDITDLRENNALEVVSDIKFFDRKNFVMKILKTKRS